MTPAEWQALRPILEAALELPTARRAAMLEAAGLDANARRELDALLAAHDRADEQQLRTGALSDIAPELEVRFRLSPDARIGAYRVVEEIAVGGMGAVYRVERADGEYRHEAALKIMRAELGGEVAAARFKNERQILAELNHPNIAKILDGGVTTEGIPYLVMEYVAGVPITEYCDQQALGIARRLQLFLDVCAAVQCAHQHLIVHRDIKPSNILVTAAGVPMLLDFGIAKALDEHRLPDRSALTRLGGSVLTPEYASPEQFRGEQVTTAADVYSLGMLLYELLCGRRAVRFQHRSSEEFARAMEVDPARPSTAIAGDDATRIGAARGESPEKLRRRLHGDLDNIVMKAIRKAPFERYPSVQQFSDDVQRHLSGQPVIARGDSYAYRIGKFVRRHRAGVAAGALLFISLIGGIIAVSYQAHQAQLQRARAERRFNDVRKLANSMMFEVHDAIRELPGSTEARRLIVQRAQEYLESLTLDTDSDPGLLRELATAYRQLATVQGNPSNTNLGDRSAAEKNYRKAIELLETATALDPADMATTLELAENYSRFADLTPSTRAVEAERLVNKAIRTLEPLHVANPGDLNAGRLLAANYAKQGLQLRNGKNYAKAVETYQKSLAIYEKLHRAHPDNLLVQRNLSHIHRFIGTVQALEGRFAPAAEHYKKAETLNADQLERDSKNPEAHWIVTLSDSNIAFVLGEQGDIDGALRYYTKVLEARTLLAQADPGDQRVRIGLAETLNYLGVNLSRKKDYAGALDAFRKSLVIREELARTSPNDDTNHYGIAWAEANLGQVYATMALRSGTTRANQLKYCRQSVQWIEKALPNWIAGQSVVWLGMGGERELAGLKQDVEDCRQLIARAERAR